MSAKSILVIVGIWYALKAMFLAMVGGVSMASVEGVADVHLWGPYIVSAISPVFVYAVGAIGYAIAANQSKSTMAIESAIRRTFQFHLGWIALCVVHFLLDPLLIPSLSFHDGVAATTMRYLGIALPWLLLSIMIFVWARRIVQPIEPSRNDKEASKATAVSETDELARQPRHRWKLIMCVSFFCLLAVCFLTTSNSDQDILRAEFDVPDGATVVSYSSYPDGPASWFVREGLAIDVVFQLNDSDYAQYVAGAEKTEDWFPTPIPDDFLLGMAAISSWEPGDFRTKRLAAFKEQLPPLPVTDYFNAALQETISCMLPKRSFLKWIMTSVILCFACSIMNGNN